MNKKLRLRKKYSILCSLLVFFHYGLYAGQRRACHFRVDHDSFSKLEFFWNYYRSFDLGFISSCFFFRVPRISHLIDNSVPLERAVKQKHNAIRISH